MPLAIPPASFSWYCGSVSRSLSRGLDRNPVSIRHDGTKVCPEVIQRVILAHEIAHSVLHTNITAAFHEFTLFDDTDRQEYEANLFAAELLLSDDCVLNALNEDQFFFQAAKALYVPAELLDFKFRVMKRKGYKLESPIVSHGNFLKTIE